MAITISTIIIRIVCLNRISKISQPQNITNDSSSDMSRIRAPGGFAYLGLGVPGRPSSPWAGSFARSQDETGILLIIGTLRGVKGIKGGRGLYFLKSALLGPYYELRIEFT